MQLQFDFTCRCHGCEQRHYDTFPPVWWAVVSGKPYCILCAHLRGV